MSHRLDDRRARFAAIDIYPVTSAPLSAGRSNLQVLDAVLAGGARIVQLRAKELAKGEVYAQAVAFRERTLAAGALLIINDHLDIALAVDADGVHLGQGDLPCTAAKRISGDLLVCISTHDREQALRAQDDGADAINIGPLFETGTKSTPIAPIGPEAISAVVAELRIPFTVMGGIKREHIPQVVAHGATRIAVVTAITAQPDMVAATRELREAIARAKPAST
ncbi:MAG: thiamine phosphate synthase [Planctomycetota bacterium]